MSNYNYSSEPRGPVIVHPAECIFDLLKEDLVTGFRIRSLPFMYRIPKKTKDSVYCQKKSDSGFYRCL